MKRRRHTPEQIIRKLPEADRLLAEGREVGEVAKALEISEATYHRWRAQYCCGLKADDVRCLKELEARVLVEDWRIEYNTLRPQRPGLPHPDPERPSLDHQPPRHLITDGPTTGVRSDLSRTRRGRDNHLW